jgi:hypothetical protein
MSDDISTLKNRLEIMEAVTTQCRRILEDDGLLYILWGSLAVICSGLTYAVFSLAFPAWTAILIWGVIFCGIGFTVTARHIAKAKQRVKTFGGTILNQLWIGAWVVLFCVFGASFLPGVPWQLFSFIPFAFGIIYFPLAVLLDWKPFYIFAFLWILSGIVMLLVPLMYSFLVLDAGIICCEIIPGIMLKLRSSQHQKVRIQETALRDTNHE